MREIHNHTNPVHLLNKLLPRIRDTAPERLRFGYFPVGVFCHGGVSINVVAVVSQSGVADPKGMIEAEVGGFVANLVKTFDGYG